MRKISTPLLIAAAIAATLPAAGPLSAQPAAPAAPGSMDVSRVKAGTYTVDSAHTQVAWTLSHFEISLFHGLFGSPTGTLKLDPAKPGESSLSIEIPIDKLVTTSPALDEHLRKPDFFDVAKFPTASFTSTKIDAKGTKAKITGNLTLHGVTKAVVLDARFTGAGANPRSKKDTIGFAATATIKRSDFGIAYGIPMVGDKVDLQITAAFERDPG